MSGEPHKPFMRSLGEFFGHVWHAIRTDPTNPTNPTNPTGPRAREVRREEQVEERDTAQGKVVLRRTIVEEVELARGERGETHETGP